MKITNSEKLILMMLCDISRKVGNDPNQGIDADFVEKAISYDNTWAIDWKYPGIFSAPDPLPSEVTQTVDYLDMWSFIEEALQTISVDQQQELDAEHLLTVFPGFDGNNEIDYLSAARCLIDDLDRFQRFKDRDLNSHMPSVSGYQRMYQVFEPIRRTLFDRGLSFAELKQTLSARHFR